METTARNRTIGGIVIGAILLVLLLILFSCTLASDPEKQAKKSGNTIGAPSGTPTLSPYATPTQKPKKPKSSPTDQQAVDTGEGGEVPAVNTGVTFDPPGQIPSGFTAPTAPQEPPSANVGICEADPGLPQCQPPAPPAPPVTPPSTGGGGGGGQPEPKVPECPTGVRDSDASVDAATISWNASAGATHYRLTVDGEAMDFDASVLSDRVGGLKGLVHSATVQAYNAAGISDPCFEHIFTTNLPGPPNTDDQAPDPIDDLVCVYNGSTSIGLNWSKPEDNPKDGTATGVDHYTVSYLGKPHTSNHSSYVADGLKTGQQVTFEVTSTDREGNESASTSVTCTAGDAPPSVPTGVTVTEPTTHTLNVSWNASTDDHGVTKYIVYRDGAEVTETTSTSFTDTGLTDDTEYDYQVIAVDTVDQQSAKSRAATGKTLDDLPPDPPADLALSGTVAATGFTVTWATPGKDNEDAASALTYEVFVNGTSYGTTAAGASSHAVSGIFLPGDYSVYVESVDTLGQHSVRSDTLTVTVPLLPSQAASASAPSASTLAKRSPSTMRSDAPSPTPSATPGEVPSLPVILGLPPSSGSSSAEPASPNTSESSSPSTDPTPRKTTEGPSQDPTPTPTESPSSSPSATTDSGSNLGDAVGGVVGAVTGGQ